MAEKVTARDETTQPTYETTFHVVQTPSGTPASYKITKHNFEKPHITTETSSATPSINVDLADIHRITALATNITSMSSGLSGTPYHGQKLIVEILDNGTIRNITWGASFRSTDAGTLPIATVANKLLRVGLMYDSADSIWECVGVTREV